MAFFPANKGLIIKKASKTITTSGGSGNAALGVTTSQADVIGAYTTTQYNGRAVCVNVAVAGDNNYYAHCYTAFNELEVLPSNTSIDIVYFYIDK